MHKAIVVDRLSKRYRHWEPSRAMTFQEVVVRGFRWRTKEFFWALSDVSFKVRYGRMMGVLGFNGAGKSTLLRLVAGVGKPTEGRIAVSGRLGAILDLGVGFHPELTGRENIVASGVSSGLTRREVLQRFDEIVAFSGLEDFLDYPLRTYSSGMNLRLAFSIASHIDPEILLIDEVLAVGDLAFQRKCSARLASFKERGCTGMIVSHGPDQILELCDDALWLDQGRVMACGPADEVVNQYVEAASKMGQASAAQATAAQESKDEGGAGSAPGGVVSSLEGNG